MHLPAGLQWRAAALALAVTENDAMRAVVRVAERERDEDQHVIELRHSSSSLSPASFVKSESSDASVD